jgi:hypothetical protein
MADNLPPSVGGYALQAIVNALQANGVLLGQISATIGTTLGKALTAAHIYVGNASNVAADVAMSGDATIDNTGAVTVSSITNASLASGHVYVGNASNKAADAAVSGDLTAVNTGAFTVAKIQGTAVGGTTGSNNVAFSNAPTFVAPVLGAATATSVNKLAITAPGTSATLTVADGKTFTASNTLTMAGTDGSTLNVGTGGTLSTAAFQSYSNGTWTPTDASGGSLTFAAAAGVYTQIGKLVTVFFVITYPSTTDGNTAKVGSLPFNEGSGLGADGVAVTGISFNSGATPLDAYLTSTGTDFRFITQSGAGLQTNLQMSGVTVRGGFSYYRS